MNISISGVRGLIFKKAAINGEASAEVNEPRVITPLDARLPDVSFRELKETGLSPSQLRVQKGVDSPVDWLTAKVEDRLWGKPGRKEG